MLGILLPGPSGLPVYPCVYAFLLTLSTPTPLRLQTWYLNMPLVRIHKYVDILGIFKFCSDPLAGLHSWIEALLIADARVTDLNPSLAQGCHGQGKKSGKWFFFFFFLGQGEVRELWYESVKLGKKKKMTNVFEKSGKFKIIWNLRWLWQSL